MRKYIAIVMLAMSLMLAATFSVGAFGSLTGNECTHSTSWQSAGGNRVLAFFGHFANGDHLLKHGYASSQGIGGIHGHTITWCPR